VLCIISGSPTDVQPVLHALAEHAARLCDADDAGVSVAQDGLLIRRAYVARRDDLPWEVDDPPAPFPPTPDTASGRAFLDGTTVQIVRGRSADVSAFPRAQATLIRRGVGAIVAIPLLREGDPLGVLWARKRQAEPFSDAQLALLETFADQAVIAIENTRLYGELQQSNATLREALDQQTAT